MAYYGPEPLVVTTGGTGRASLTIHDVLVGNGTTAVTLVAPGATSGVPFISQGASADPIYGTAVVAGGGTGAITLTGLLTGNGTSAITATAITQFNVITAGASNAPNSVAPTATSGVPLISQGAASQPIFGTAVVAGGGTGSTTFNTTGVVISGASSTTALASVTLTDGQIAIGSSAGNPAAATISAGTGISVTNGHNTITIAATGSEMVWTDEAISFNAAVGNGYFTTGTVTATMPASPAQGNTIAFIVDAANVLTITANTGQVIRIGSAVSASAGTAASNARGDSVTLVYRSSDTAWIAQHAQGTWTVT